MISDELIAQGFSKAWQDTFVKNIEVVTFKASDTKHLLKQQEDAYIDIHADTLGKEAISLLVDMLQEKEAPQSRHQIIQADLVIFD